MKAKIILVGGGGHCKSVIDVIELENKYTIVGIIDKKELIGQDVLGYKIIGCDDDLEKLFEEYKYAIVTVGQIRSNSVRVKIFNRLNTIGYKIPTIISPLAYVSKHSYIDKGTVVMHQSLINSNVQIGKNCIINTKALIEHDCVIADGCHISTGAVINGGVLVKENSFVGSHATIVELSVVQAEHFVKAGEIYVGES